MTRLFYSILFMATLAAFLAGCPYEEEVVVGTNAGGVTTATGGIPTTSQPAAIQGPTYNISLLDPLYEATAGAKAVVLGDIDNDGVMDAVSISDASQPVQLHLRNTTTQLFETLSIAGGAPISKSNDVELADFNGDGKLDIVVLVHDTGYAPPPSVELIGAVVMLLQGAEPRDPFQWVRVTLPFFENDSVGLTDLTVADLDGVNGPDLAVLSNQKAPEPGQADSFVHLYINPGGADAADSANWTENTLDADIPDYSRVDFADMDKDGDLDLIVGVPQASSYNVRWLQNPLVEADIAEVTTQPWRARIVGQQEGGADLIAIGDVDGDGNVDVTSSHKADGLTQWFRNPGPIALAAEIFPVPWSVYHIGIIDRGAELSQLQLVDLDSDGVLQCFVAYGGEAWGFKRQANLEDYWVPFMLFDTDPVAEIGRPAFDDFNADGKLDFIVPLDREGLLKDQFIIFARQ